MGKKVWLWDSGHGGVIDGEYVTAPDKMYEHSPEEIFYEGVSNRLFKKRILELSWEKGLHVIDLCPTELDLPVWLRADLANAYYAKYRNAVVISHHSNAGGGQGFEVYTSIGQTASDKYAEIWAHEIMAMFDLRMRVDKRDGDLDKESQFDILTQTHGPSILTECLFFDDYDDYKRLIDPQFRERYARAVVNFMEKAELVL